MRRISNHYADIARRRRPDRLEKLLQLEERAPLDARFGARPHRGAATLVQHPLWDQVRAIAFAAGEAPHSGMIAVSDANWDLTPEQRVPRVAHRAQDGFPRIVSR